MKSTLPKWRENIIEILGSLEFLNKLDKHGDMYIKDDELKMNEDCKETLRILNKLNVLKQALENIEKQIKESLYYMMDNNVKIYEDDEILIKCTWKKTDKTRFDQKAFKRDYPELYAQYLKTEESKGYVNLYWKEGE